MKAMKSGEVEFLDQLVRSLDDSFNEMHKSFKKKDAEKFNAAKKMALKINEKIIEVLNG